MEQLKKEKKYEEVYGDTFALYSRKDMNEFIEPFQIRFQRNGLDAAKIFKGKKCFDAGCGNGRGSLFMLMNGAAHVTAFDFSEKNIASTKRFTSEYGFSNIECKQGSLEAIPFEAGTFDFVWCNGVIMHTGRPDKCLSEISRILKPGGNMWLYIYGSGGAYWRIIFNLRRLMSDVPIDSCMATLKLLRYETRYIAEFIDDWYASYLRTYTQADLGRRLAELGFESPQVLKFGVDYDTSHRLNSFSSSQEKDLMGEGDLRYFLTKGKDAKTGGTPISEDEYGSAYEWPELIKKEIDPVFVRLEEICAGNRLLKVAVAARIQRELRIMLTDKRPFPLKELEAMMLDTANTAIAAQK